MLRGNANIECNSTALDDEDSNDDNVSLECADSGLGLPSDHDPDRAAVHVPVCSLSTACYQPVMTSTPTDVRHGFAYDNQPVY